MSKLNILSVKDLRLKKPVELEKHLVELTAAQTALAHDLATNKSKATHNQGNIKRQIARTKTIAHQTKREEK